MTVMSDTELDLPPMEADSRTPDLERRVRSNDADTSWDAAQITAVALRSVKDSILLILSRGEAMTDDQIFAKYEAMGGTRTPQRLRTAREELVHPKHGSRLVKPFTELGYSKYGNDSQRWTLA